MVKIYIAIPFGSVTEAAKHKNNASKLKPTTVLVHLNIKHNNRKRPQEQESEVDSSSLHPLPGPHQTQHPLLHNPSQGLQGPHGLQKIHLLPYPHPRTSGQKHAWHT